MRVNCREQIANPAEPVNGQDERRKCAAIPRSRSITRPQATTFAQQKCCSKKENTILTDGGSFCDYPQVLLFAPSHIARKGECEGETFAGFPTRVRSPARRRPLLRSKSAAPKKKDTHVGVFLFWSGRRGSTRYRHPTNGRAIRRSPAGPLDSTRFAPVKAASSSLPATFQKENTILTDGVSFCDCPQVLLSALPHIARKGECEGGTFDGFPHSRSITRPQATTFA